MADRPRERRPAVTLTFDADVWEQEVERFPERSQARSATERTRRVLERSAGDRSKFQRCEREGADRTQLPNCVKSYIPIDRPSSEAPFGFVFIVGIDEGPPRRFPR